MFSPGYLQSEQNTAGWLWFAIFAVLLVVLIIWWLNRRKADQVPVEPEMQVQRESSPDDLTRIEGIGPKVAKVLSEAGINTFEALARADRENVQQTLNAAGFQMMNPEGWIEQAKLAAKGDWDAFEQLQEELKGGRRD